MGYYDGLIETTKEGKRLGLEKVGLEQQQEELLSGLSLESLQQQFGLLSEGYAETRRGIADTQAILKDIGERSLSAMDREKDLVNEQAAGKKKTALAMAGIGILGHQFAQGAADREDRKARGEYSIAIDPLAGAETSGAERLKSLGKQMESLPPPDFVGSVRKTGNAAAMAGATKAMQGAQAQLRTLAQVGERMVGTLARARETESKSYAARGLMAAQAVQLGHASTMEDKGRGAEIYKAREQMVQARSDQAYNSLMGAITTAAELALAAYTLGAGSGLFAGSEAGAMGSVGNQGMFSSVAGPKPMPI